MATISGDGPYLSGLFKLATQLGVTLGRDRGDGHYGLSAADRKSVFGQMTDDEIAGLEADEEHLLNGKVHAIIFDQDGEVIGRVYKDGGVALNGDFTDFFGGGDAVHKAVKDLNSAEDRTAALADLLGNRGRIFVMTEEGPQLYGSTVALSEEGKKLNEITRALAVLKSIARSLKDPRAQELLSRIVDFDTVIKAGDNSFVFGTAGNDRIKLRRNSAAFSGDGDDFITGYHGNAVHAGAGNDIVTMRRDAVVHGGGGDDVIRTWSNAKVSGGDGNDVIRVQGDSTVSGGAGDDDIEAGSNARIAGGDGNDIISAYENAQISGGAGNDDIRAYDTAVLDGGAGDDALSAYDDAIVSGGAGNDRISVYRNATIAYGRGDGHDVIQAEGNGNRLNFGAGIMAAQTRVEKTRDSVIITFDGLEGSITLKGGLATLRFADGTAIDVAAALKPAAGAVIRQGLSAIA